MKTVIVDRVVDAEELSQTSENGYTIKFIACNPNIIWGFMNLAHAAYIL